MSDFRLNGHSEFGCDRGTAAAKKQPRLKTVADVLAVLEEQIEIVRKDGPTGRLEQARTIGSLASVAVRAIEAGDLEKRIEMLEQVLKQRNGETKQ